MATLLGLLCACGTGLQSSPQDAGEAPQEETLPPVTLEEITVTNHENGALTVRVRGENFSEGSLIVMTRRTLATQVVSSTELRATIPPAFLEEREHLYLEALTTSAQYPHGARSPRLGFNLPAPELTSVEPASVRMGSPDPTTVFLYGKNFVKNSTVTFRGVLYPFHVVSPTSGVVNLPARLTLGDDEFEPIRVSVPAPISADTNSGLLRVSVPFP
ncbi:hypothetical protein LXT21_30450 [Myxococcus sp. K38C18041901]|uniref:hypothetical protein n=1 Tax=Myxococcus guangdongensis TaxID=2906760 RepID=UPI0020A77D12|nr:hypothetical protein [Myxococcus guangdongensis]MCP3063105.1 hypothetical protein [Myxococcus guangdongensis]